MVSPSIRLHLLRNRPSSSQTSDLSSTALPLSPSSRALKSEVLSTLSSEERRYLCLALARAALLQPLRAGRSAIEPGLTETVQRFARDHGSALVELARDVEQSAGLLTFRRGVFAVVAKEVGGGEALRALARAEVLSLCEGRAVTVADHDSLGLALSELAKGSREDRELSFLTQKGVRELVTFPAGVEALVKARGPSKELIQILLRELPRARRSAHECALISGLVSMRCTHAMFVERLEQYLHDWTRVAANLPEWKPFALDALRGLSQSGFRAIGALESIYRLCSHNDEEIRVAASEAKAAVVKATGDRIRSVSYLRSLPLRWALIGCRLELWARGWSLAPASPKGIVHTYFN